MSKGINSTNEKEINAWKSTRRIYSTTPVQTKHTLHILYITVIVNSVKLQCAQDHPNVRSFQSLSLLIYFRFVFR